MSKPAKSIEAWAEDLRKKCQSPVRKTQQKTKRPRELGTRSDSAKVRKELELSLFKLNCSSWAGSGITSSRKGPWPCRPLLDAIDDYVEQITGDETALRIKIHKRG